MCMRGKKLGRLVKGGKKGTLNLTASGAKEKIEGEKKGGKREVPRETFPVPKNTGERGWKAGRVSTNLDLGRKGTAEKKRKKIRT